MRKYVWVLLFIVAAPIQGQQNFASISFGASQPLADYKKTGDLSSSGYAKAGGTIKFDAAYFPVSYLGLGASFSFGSNYSQGDLLLEDISDHILNTASSVIDLPHPDSTAMTYVSGFWNYINLFIGPHFSIRATQRLYFDLKMLAGLSIIRLPDQQLSISDDDTFIYATTSGNNLSFGFNAGAGLRYKLNENIAIKLGVDYSQSRANFEYDFRLFDDVAEGIEPVDANFSLRVLEVSAGLAYSF